MRAIFWLLAVVVLLNLNSATQMFTGVPSAFKPVLVLCSLLLILIGLLKVPMGRALGVPGLLIIAALGSYLVIASTVSLTTGFGPVWDAWEHFEDYAGSIILILAAAFGGYAVMRIIGSEPLLKVLLVLLTMDCIAILATPLLSEFYVITFQSSLYRFLGNYKNPNVAGLTGCLTAVLALSFLQVRRHRWFAYLALTLAVGATVGTFSRAAFLILIFVLMVFFLFNHRGIAFIVKWLSVAISIGVIFLMIVDLDFYLLEQRWQRLWEIATLLPGHEVSASISVRQELLNLALDETVKSPLVGNGLGTIHSLDRAPYSSQGIPQGSHNQYLILVGEAGIIPIVLFLLFLGSLLRLRLTVSRSVGRDAVVGWAIVIGLGCIASHNILALRTVDFLIGLSCAIATSYLRTTHPSSSV